VHAFIVFQLLSRRIERDLLLASALLSSQNTSSKKATGSGSGKGTKQTTKTPAVDARLYPAVVKLLDTILQSLEQMRGLSIVDEGPDLASAVEERISYTRARR
jgi:signal recognition particle subunit SRP68